jgi:hypothetical protein
MFPVTYRGAPTLPPTFSSHPHPTSLALTKGHARRRDSWRSSLSYAAPFHDTVKESLFSSASTLAFVRRAPAVFFIFSLCIFFLTCQFLSFYDGIFIPVAHMIAALWVAVLASVAMSPTMQNQHAWAIEQAVEVTLVLIVPTFISTIPSVELSIFLSIGAVSSRVLRILTAIRCHPS